MRISSGDLVAQGDFDFAQVAVISRHLAGAAEQPVHQGQPEPRRNDEQAGALQRLGFEQRDVRRVGQVFDEFLVADDLELGRAGRRIPARRKMARRAASERTNCSWRRRMRRSSLAARKPDWRKS